MSEESKAGNSGTTATGEGKPVENTSSTNGGNASTTPVDQSAKIADLEARLAKETKDKEIYRAGLLSAKDFGKKSKRITEEDLSDPEKLDSAIEAKIQDRDLEQKVLQEAAVKATEDERLKAENEELRRSLEAAKTAGYGGPSSGSGHNENSESKQAGYWSDSQKNELRQMYSSRNMYSSEQIEKMLAKAEEIARNKAGTSPRGNDMTNTRSY